MWNTGKTLKSCMSENDPHKQTITPAAHVRARIGLALFAIYVLFYGGFMALVLFRPALLSARPFGGVNLAIASGMGLIAVAFVLAIIYMVACWLVEGGQAGRQRPGSRRT